MTPFFSGKGMTGRKLGLKGQLGHFRKEQLWIYLRLGSNYELAVRGRRNILSTSVLIMDVVESFPTPSSFPDM